MYVAWYLYLLNMRNKTLKLIIIRATSNWERYHMYTIHQKNFDVGSVNCK